MLDKITNLVPENNRVLFSQNITKYVALGCSAVIPCEKLNNVLAKVSDELINSFFTDIRTNSVTTCEDPKYAEIPTLDTQLTPFMANITQQFRITYSTYKTNLTMLKTTIQLNYNDLYLQSNGLLINKLLQLIPSNLVAPFFDHHYFCHLLRIHLLGPSPEETFQLPLFSPEELNQVTGYLAELSDLLFIMFYINIKFNLDINVFQNIPVSKTINKKPSQFFKQPITKNTYSQLLNYLSSVNHSLINTLIKHYTKLPFTRPIDSLS